MKIFIDTANVDEIKAANDLGVICGVTTNPSLIAKEGRIFEEVVQEITNLYTFVVAEQKAPVEYFPVEVQEKVAEILPEEVKVETLECTEFVTVRELGYKETYGDVVVNFSFTTQYKAQQKVIVLMGFYTGEVDEAGNPIVEWMPIEATALEDGTLDVTMTQEMLVKFGEAKTVAMAVLSEQTELEAAPAVPAA